MLAYRSISGSIGFAALTGTDGRRVRVPGGEALQGAVFCGAVALAGAPLIASTLAAVAQPCGASADIDAAPLYPLPQDAKRGFVGRDGEWRPAPRWRQVRPLSEGVAAVETGAGWGLIAQDGDYVAEPGARDADRVVSAGETFALSPFKPMSDGRSAATPKDGAAHHVTAPGDVWTPPGLAGERVMDRGSFSDGLAWVRDKLVRLDRGGATVIASTACRRAPGWPPCPPPRRAVTLRRGPIA